MSISIAHVKRFLLQTCKYVSRTKGNERNCFIWSKKRNGKIITLKFIHWMWTALAKSPTHSHHASMYKHNALYYWNVFRIKLWYVKQFQPNANSHNTRKCEIYAIRSTWLISQAETNTWWVFKKKWRETKREREWPN